MFIQMNELIEIDEQIKSANQSNQQVKGAFVIEVVKITTAIIFESKKLVGRLKHRNKRRNEKCYAFIKKDISEAKNTLQNILENQTFQRIQSLLWPISTKWIS